MAVRLSTIHVSTTYLSFSRCPSISLGTLLLRHLLLTPLCVPEPRQVPSTQVSILPTHLLGRHPSVRPPVHPSIHTSSPTLFFSLSIITAFKFVHPSIHPSASPSIRPSRHRPPTHLAYPSRRAGGWTVKCECFHLLPVGRWTSHFSFSGPQFPHLYNGISAFSFVEFGRDVGDDEDYVPGAQ